MVNRKFVCPRCEQTFEVEIFEPGEAEERRVRSIPVRYPRWGGPAEPIK